MIKKLKTLEEIRTEFPSQVKNINENIFFRYSLINSQMISYLGDLVIVNRDGMLTDNLHINFIFPMEFFSDNLTL
jgi:hypothetical protein